MSNFKALKKVEFSRIYKAPYDIFFLFLAGAIPVVSAYLISFRILPPMSGYTIFPFQDSQLIPYRDYFDPVTPLTYFIAHVTADPNYGLHNYLVLSMWDLPIFGLSCYFLARLLTSRTSSLILSTLMTTLILNLRLEQIGGWNTQFYMLLSISFVFFIYANIQLLATSELQISKPKRTILFSLFSGFFASLAMLDKQTTALSLLVIVILMTFWLWWEKNKEFSKKIRKSCTYFVFGAIPATLLTLIYLILNGAIKPFIEDMLSGGGKHPIFSSFPNIVFQAITRCLPPVAIIALIVVFVLFYIRQKKLITMRLLVEGDQKLKDNISTYFLLLAASCTLWRFSSLYDSQKELIFFLQNSLICVLPFAVNYIYPRLKDSLINALYFFVFLFLPFCNEWPLRNTNPGFIQNIGFSNSSTVTFSLFILFATSIFLLPKAFDGLFTENFLLFFPKSKISYRDFKFLVTLTNIFALASFINLFASGGGIFVQFFIPCLIVYFGIFISIFHSIAVNQIVKHLPILLITLALISGASLTLQSPYAWFNWSEPGIFSPHFSSSLPRNYGFQLSKDDLDFYNRIIKDSKIAAKESGAGNNATVFSFSNIINAAEVTGLPNYSKLKCVLLWFDVCPNNMAATDLTTFKKSPPNVIIWEPIPAADMQGNEAVFVHGHSALQDWEDFQAKQLNNGKWHMIDDWTSPLSPGWSIVVFSVLPSTKK